MQHPFRLASGWLRNLNESAKVLIEMLNQFHKSTHRVSPPPPYLGSRFSCKNGGKEKGNLYIVGVSVEAGEVKHKSQPGVAYKSVAYKKTM